MYVTRMVGLPSGMSTVPVYPDPLDPDPLFMFGTFDPADGTSSESIRALNEAILGIREDGAPMAIAAHRHAEVAAEGISSAFMFGVNPEQPSPAAPGEPPLSFWAAEMGVLETR